MSSPKVEARIEGQITCPLLSIMGYHDRGDPVHCDMDECAWWNDTRCECLIVTMARDIDRLSSLVENLVKSEREEEK